MTNSTKDYYIKERQMSFDDRKELNEKIHDNLVLGLSTLALAGVVFGLGDYIVENNTVQNIIACGNIGVSLLAFNNLRKNIKLKAGLPTITKQENPKQYKK